MIEISDELPEGYVLARNIYDMVNISPKWTNYHEVLLGLKLVLKNSEGRYEHYELTQTTTEENIINYIESERLYIQK